MFTLASRFVMTHVTMTSMKKQETDNTNMKGEGGIKVDSAWEEEVFPDLLVS